MKNGLSESDGSGASKAAGGTDRQAEAGSFSIDQAMEILMKGKGGN